MQDIDKRLKMGDTKNTGEHAINELFVKCTTK